MKTESKEIEASSLEISPNTCNKDMSTDLVFVHLTLKKEHMGPKSLVLAVYVFYLVSQFLQQLLLDLALMFKIT